MDIRYSKSALRFLKKTDYSTKKRIIDAIERLPGGDVKKLKGINGYRMRIGQYRVIYDQYGNVIDIIDIGNRGEIYK